jgi:tetratricopeptide (TPR) repeat protein
MNAMRFASIGLLFLLLASFFSVRAIYSPDKMAPLAQAVLGFVAGLACLFMAFKREPKAEQNPNSPLYERKQPPDDTALGQRALGFKVEERVNFFGFISSGCAIVSLLLVIVGARVVARLVAGLVEGGVLANVLGVVGAVIGVVIVGLFVVFILFPLAVMESYDDDPHKRMKHLQEELQEREDVLTWHSLGSQLELLGRREEARDAYLKALRLQTSDPGQYVQLGYSLETVELPDEAIAAYRKAIQLDPQLSDAHMKLGMVFRAQGRLDEAIAEYREVLRIGDRLGGENQLGLALRDKGMLDGAIALFRRADEIESRAVPEYPSPYAEAVRETELMARAAERLPAVLAGKDRFESADECLACARLCQLPYRKQDAASARFFAEAFAKEPNLAEDLQKDYRYRAARSAARAGCGQSDDGASLDEEERARLRCQAQNWLRADINAWSSGLPPTADNYQHGDRHPSGYWLISVPMERWLKDSGIAGVREPEALAMLPEAERQQWQELWSRATNMLNRGDAQVCQIFLKPAGMQDGGA